MEFNNSSQTQEEIIDDLERWNDPEGGFGYDD
jgi:hypothetical protein